MRTLITGANGGFGHLSTLSLARAGHDVIATMRNLDKGDALRTAFDAEGLSAEFRRLDVCDEDSVREAIGDANELDAVVNNAGFEVRAPIEEVDDDLVVAQFDTNVRGPMRVMRAVLPAWRERGSGVIVNVTSVAGVVGVPFGGIYAASKHALEGITESMFWEVSPFGIRLALIEPGAFETAFEANTVNPPGWDTSPYRANADRFRESMGNLSGGVPQDNQLVADAIVEAVTNPDAPFRTKVGVDADLVIDTYRSMPFEDFEAAMRGALNFYD